MFSRIPHLPVWFWLCSEHLLDPSYPLNLATSYNALLSWLCSPQCSPPHPCNDCLNKRVIACWTYCDRISMQSGKKEKKMHLGRQCWTGSQSRTISYLPGKAPLLSCLPSYKAIIVEQGPVQWCRKRQQLCCMDQNHLLVHTATQRLLAQS